MKAIFDLHKNGLTLNYDHLNSRDLVRVPALVHELIHSDRCSIHLVPDLALDSQRLDADAATAMSMIWRPPMMLLGKNMKKAFDAVSFTACSADMHSSDASTKDYINIVVTE